MKTFGARYALAFVGVASSLLKTLTLLHDEAQRERNDDVLVALVEARARGAIASGLSPEELVDIHRGVTGQKINAEDLNAYVVRARERRSARGKGPSALGVIGAAIKAAKGQLDAK